MSTILVVGDDPLLHEVTQVLLEDDGHVTHHAPDGQSGLAMLAKAAVDLVIVDLSGPAAPGIDFIEQLRGDHIKVKRLVITGPTTADAVVRALRKDVCDFLPKPFTADELRASVDGALNECSGAGIEVVSAWPEWVELRVPCQLGAVSSVERLAAQLEVNLPAEMREAVALALREMLNNAIEHGCKLDATKHVEVSHVRFKHAIVCCIKDPGEGFDPCQLQHAAVSNPVDEPFRHVSLRAEKELRPGGFGILLTNQLVDGLVYNERRNHVMFIKYVP